MSRKIVHIETKSVCPGIFNRIIPGSTDEAIVTWSDGSQTTGAIPKKRPLPRPSASVPALKSCYTQARTWEELLPRIKEVIELCLQEEEPLVLQFEGVQQVEIEA